MDKRVKDTLLTLGIRSTYQASTILSMLYVSALMTEIRSSPSASTYIRKLPGNTRHLKIMSNIVCAPP